MATDHGFNVGLPDNLGMFNVFSIIHCVHFSNHTFKTFSNLFVIVIGPCPLMQMRYPRHVPSGYLFFFVASFLAKRDTLIILIFIINQEYWLVIVSLIL